MHRVPQKKIQGISDVHGLDLTILTLLSVMETYQVVQHALQFTIHPVC